MSGLRAIWTLVPGGRARRLLLAALALSSLGAVFALVPAFVIFVISAVIFDKLDIGLTVMQVVFAGIAAVITRLGLQLVARNTAGTATEFLSQDLRARAAVTIGALPLGVAASIAPGSLETILLDDVETLGQYVSAGLIDFAGASAMLLTAAIVLFVCDVRSATAALVLTLAAAALARRGSARDAAAVARERESRERLSAAIFSAVRSLGLQRSLPAAGAAHPIRELAAADRRASDVRLSRSAARGAQRDALAAALPAAIVIAVAALGAGRLALPVLVLFAAFGVRISGALTYVLRAGTDRAPALESARRIAALLDRPPMPEGVVEPPPDATLRFSHVDFGYPGSTGRRVLRDIDFSAEAGRVTALVGRSGSGKTTITRLAARLWDVDAGSVTLGGVDLRSMPLDALMRRVACVFQDVALLDDTVAANLKLGRPDAGDDAMVLAAAAAGADAFISALPDGYATLVGDRGLHLSRGERQRLQIARALLKDAPFVILDEPTASMDPATELEVQAALAPLFAGKTVLVVAHRLSTIAGADHIVVLGDDGRIEAQGRHRELLVTSPTYTRLWADYRSSDDWASVARALSQ